MTPTLQELAGMIDQTLLRPDVGPAAFALWVDRCRDAGFATLCVPPTMVRRAAELTCDTRTEICTVIGFPLGYSLAASKADDARLLVASGASELDMVIDIGALLEGDDEVVADDIAGVVVAASEASGGRARVKAILETGYLNDAEIARACALAVRAGADYVKTSTGFGPRGASADDVALMRESVGEHAGVKAAGGIRDLDAALEMLAAGASRIGTSAGIEILQQAAVAGL